MAKAVAPFGKTALHAHNEAAPFKPEDLIDDQEYEVTLTRTATFAMVNFQPDHHHKMTGAFIKGLMAKPENDGAVSGAKNIT
jgi:hypothetical protein